MKKFFKKKALLVIGLPLVLTISIISVFIVGKENNKGMNQEFVIDLSEKNYRKVYLLDENKYLVPLSLEVSNREYLVDEIYTVVSNLRDLKVKGFNNVIAKDVKINSIELNDGVLNIDFSSEFLNYDANMEENIIESLTWSVLDFNEIKGLTISVDGVKLKKMPLNGLNLPEVLNKDIGINKYHDLMKTNQNSDSVVVIYEKVVNGNTYYVPLTRSTMEESDKVSTLNSAIGKDVSLLSGLRKIDDYSKVIKMILDEDDTVSVNLDKASLVEDNLIDSCLYELMVMTLYYNDIDYKVNFFIDEESVGVSGYNLQEEISVNNIVINNNKI